jgi:hypothetical protein
MADGAEDLENVERKTLPAKQAFQAVHEIFPADTGAQCIR